MRAHEAGAHAGGGATTMSRPLGGLLNGEISM